MSTPIPPIVPIPGNGDGDDAGIDGVPTQDVDGETTIDPDADDSQINSADADRLAAGDDNA